MADTALEGAPSLPAMIVGKKFEVADCCHMKQRCDGQLLLALVRGTGGHCLEGRHIRLAKLEMCGWLPVDHLDRQPWEITAIGHAQSLMAGLREW